MSSLRLTATVALHPKADVSLRCNKPPLRANAGLMHCKMIGEAKIERPPRGVSGHI
jgi:hypothetical protein